MFVCLLKQLKDVSKEALTTFAEMISLNYISLKVGVLQWTHGTSFLDLLLPSYRLVGGENILSNCLSPRHLDVKKSCHLCNPRELIHEEMKMVINLFSEL